jgi:hypothetical protein
MQFHINLLEQHFVDAMNHREHVFCLSVDQEIVVRLLGIKVNNPVNKI